MILPYVFSQLSGAVAASLLLRGLVGAVIALEALFAGPISGASMNPARSFAPALVSQHLANLWIYLVAPVTGALIAVVGCRCIRKDCCSVPLHGRIDQVS